MSSAIQAWGQLGGFLGFSSPKLCVNASPQRVRICFFQLDPRSHITPKRSIQPSCGATRGKSSGFGVKHPTQHPLRSLCTSRAGIFSPRSPAPLVQGPTPSADSRAGLACTIRAITANYSSARRGTPKSRGDGPRKATGQPGAPAGAATSGQKGEESKTQVGAQGNASPLISIAKSGGIQVNKAQQGPGALWP